MTYLANVFWVCILYTLCKRAKYTLVREQGPEILLNIINIARIILYYPAQALRALGLLQADGALTVGWGKTFWRVGRFFYFMKTTVTRTRKVDKSIPRCEMDCLSKGYKDFWPKINTFRETWKQPFHHISGLDPVRCHCGSFFWWPRQSHQVSFTKVQN